MGSWLFPQALTVALAVCVFSGAAGGADPSVPVVGLREHPKYTIVNIQVPAIPGLVCEVWCYEDRLGRAVDHRVEAGTVVLVHKHREATATTRFVPVHEGVEIQVAATGPVADVRAVDSLNPCVQFHASPLFGNQGDYVADFVARCFVVLDRGLTRLKDTRRVPGTRPRPNDRANLPNPWIQEYVPTWRRHPGQRKGQRGSSLDRPVLPLIGVVSRDGKHLAAVAWPESARLGQVWHCCVHPRPRIIESFDAKTGETRTQGKLYFMPYDEAKLLAAFERDFPGFRGRYTEE